MLDLQFYKPVPDLDWTVEMSVLLISPLTVTSVRKLELVTGLPDCACVCEMSVEFTRRLAEVSPRSTPIGMTTLPLLPLTVTPNKVIEIVCALATPVRLTDTWLPLVLVLETDPVPEVTLAELIVTAAGNVTTTKWLFEFAP